MYNKKSICAIVVGGGTSRRMGFDKLAYCIDGKTVLWHSVNAMAKNQYIDTIVVVASPEVADMADEVFADIKKPVCVVQGGETRDKSVQNGLAFAKSADMVAIHDAARPFVTDTVITNTIIMAEKYGGAAPAVRVKDTIKQSDDGEVVANTPCRDILFAVQTPQVFDCRKYILALLQLGDKIVTDDCMVFENAGYTVALSEGNYNNIKITTKEDLPKENTMQKIKIGHGYDVHQLVENRKLILGGVEIEYDKGLLGHSDADVLCHCISDALLGAVALGDIGKHFPDTDATFKNADSIELLKKVCELVLQSGFEVSNIDATVLCQAPKIAIHIEKMRQNIAIALDTKIDNISVKATTEEGLGFTGKGQGIAAHCVCLLQSI